MKHNTKTQKPESREEKERNRERSEKNFKKIERDTQNAREGLAPPQIFRKKKEGKKGREKRGGKERSSK